MSGEIISKTDDQTPTTVQSRRWITEDVVSIITLLRDYNTIVRQVLPPDVRAAADELARGGKPWPQWLVIGVCVRFTLRSMQIALAEAEVPGFAFPKRVDLVGEALGDPPVESRHTPHVPTKKKR